MDEPKNPYSHALAPAIATLALSASGDELVYMPLYSTQFYAMDLKSNAVTLIENTVAKSQPCDINSQFTRMATGTDGAIYTLNNSGSQLLKISKTNGKFDVVDLGAVTNDASNGDHRIQVMAEGFGGDMVADKDNNFYIFSASGNVFHLNTQTKVVKFLGKVSGLPENYSLNGAAVNSDGSVLVGSARGGDLYAVNLDNLSAKPIYGGVQHQIYDLASKYFVGEKPMEIAVLSNDIYPTKVTEGEVTIQLEPSVSKSFVKAEVFNSVGTKVIEKSMRSERKLSLLGLPQGIYIINITGEKGETLVAKKVFVAK